MRPAFLSLALAPLAACALVAPDSPMVYSDPAIACDIAGESPSTIDLLDDAATLYACPPGVEIEGMLPVGSDMGVTYYSVPNR